MLAGFLGWTLDAFDFFVIVFLYDTLAREFSVSKKAIVLTTTATLALRPVGALLFGLLADRYGRRIPLMANVIYFSIIELLCGFAPNLHRVPDSARAVWHRHGRRMGRGRFTGDGGGAAALARHSQRNSAGWVLDGLSAGFGRGAFRAAYAGLALDVLAGRAARVVGALHSHESARSRKPGRSIVPKA